VTRPPLRVWVWTAVTMVIAVVAVALWRGSDAAATSSTTAPAAPAVTGTPAAQLSVSWSAGSGPAPRRVVASGLVLTTGPHGLSLRDPLTGQEAWHYTRANAGLCDATTVNGVVVAVFGTGGRCDEAVGLRADTGVRAWYRNLDFGEDVHLAGTDRIVLASSSSGIATLDPAGGSTRWRHAPGTDCRLVGSDVGSAGVVVVQRCGNGAAVQVELFDGFAGSSTWVQDVASDGVPVRLAGADRLVDLVVGDQLRVLSPTDGAQLQALALPPLPTGESATEPLQQTGAADLALVWVRGTVYAIDEDTGAPRWQQTATGLPAATSDPDSPAVLVPETGALVRRSVADGAELGRSTVDAQLPAGGRAAVVGPAVVYSTADSVLVLR
jgi:outer membrane protein assembly factor BamB